MFEASLGYTFFHIKGKKNLEETCFASIEEVKSECEYI